MKEECIIIGAGTYGQVFAEYLKSYFNIIGFIDDNPDLNKTKIKNLEVLGDLNYLLKNIDKNIHLFVPIGNPIIRKQILDKVRNVGFKTPNFLHNSCNIDNSVSLGFQGVYILQSVVVMPLCEIGNDVILSSGTVISHHTTISEGVFISFGVNVGASLFIDTCAFVGVGSTIITGVTRVGCKSLIGAGAVILKDVPDFAVIVGNPGRIIKYNSGV
jgi:sugar O-acyltransferase (sialic acid O-acetyltransferase NeuD family)